MVDLAQNSRWMVRGTQSFSFVAVSFDVALANSSPQRTSGVR